MAFCLREFYIPYIVLEGKTDGLIWGRAGNSSLIHIRRVYIFRPDSRLRQFPVSDMLHSTNFAQNSLITFSYLYSEISLACPEKLSKKYVNEKKCGAKIVKKSNNIANQQSMQMTGERRQSSPPVKCVIIIYTKLLARNTVAYQPNFAQFIQILKPTK